MAASTLPRRFFDYLLIDECGQTTEPDILIAIAAAPNAQIVLAGDPAQLGPVVKSPYGLHFGLNLSFLDRLMKLPVYGRDKTGNFAQFYVSKLKINYRSRPELLTLTSRLFYEGELETGVSPTKFDPMRFSKILPNEKIPIWFKKIENGKEERITGTFSWYNSVELIQVLSTVRELISLGVDTSEIGQGRIYKSIK